MNHQVSWMTVALAVGLGAGCIVPPMRIGAGGGAAAGSIDTVDRQGHTNPHGTAAVGELRAAFTPLAFADSPPESFDLGIGCAFDYLDALDGAQRHDQMVSPFVEGAWFVHRVINRTQRWRVGPTFLIEAPTRLRDPADRGAGLPLGVGGGVLAEIAERVDGPAVLGTTRGEWGIGVAVRGGVRHDIGDSYGYVMVTIEARLPFLAALPLPSPSRRPGIND